MPVALRKVKVFFGFRTMMRNGKGTSHLYAAIDIVVCSPSQMEPW